MDALKNPWAGVRRITWSVMQKWLSCRRRWYYRYIGRFAPPDGIELLAGSLMHALFEAEAGRNMLIQRANQVDEQAEKRRNNVAKYVEVRLQQAEPLFQSFREEALAPFVGATWLTALPNYTEEDVTETETLIRAMYTNWLRLRGAADLQQYEFLFAEKMFEIILPTPNNGKLRGWRLGGVLDQLLRDRQSGKLVLRELKTTSSDATAFERRVDLDPQVRIYAVAAELAGLTKGEPIEAVQYIVLRKAIPKLPKDVQCKRCSGKKRIAQSKLRHEDRVSRCVFYDAENAIDCPDCYGVGTLPSTDKRLDSVRFVVLAHLENFGYAQRLDTPTGFDLHQRHGWLFVECDHERWVIDPKYHELVNGLPGWEKFISLSTHWLEPADKQEAMAEAWRVAQEMQQATRHYGRNGENYVTAFPRNTAQCTGPAGFCEYKQICIAKMAVENFENGNGWKHDLPDNPEIEAILKKQKEKKADGKTI